MASAAKKEPKENTSLVFVGPVNRGGRPSSYSDAIVQEICERLAAGETLTRICEDEHLPTVRTVSNWMMRRPKVFSDIARAREAQMHLEAEQIRDIADNAYEDYYIDYVNDPDGNRVPVVKVDGESVKRAALRISARQWRAERLNRRAYGNSTKIEHELAAAPAHGAEGLPPGLGWLAGLLPEGEPPEKPE